jgi:guanylate kinase
MTSEEIQRKLKSFAYAKMNDSLYTNLKHVQESISKGKPLLLNFDDMNEDQIKEYSGELPNIFIEFRNKYTYL